ncbi:hypothetical protein SBDP1_1210020 [Syntrophobacter sp. SbD1]|nr:hypothetical protein SBDP1_1210020 [Syntrophobacter sp. SbD1]
MAGLNVRLRPLGLVYGAGYGIGMKPTFFLAECADSNSVGGNLKPGSTTKSGKC